MDIHIATLDSSQVITGSLSRSSHGPAAVSKAPAFERALKTIARELRAPLANLSVMIELMEAYARSRDLTMTAHEAGQVKGAADALSRHIHNLLECAHETGNALGFKPGLVDLSVVLTRGLAAVRPLASSRNIEIEVDALAPLVINGDARLLSIALSHLAELMVRRSLRGSPLRCTAGFKAGRAVITLMSGKARHAADEFEAELRPFSGPLSPIAMEGSATALTPWMARLIIEHHGGRIDVVTRKSGTRLEIVLPARLF